MKGRRGVPYQSFIYIYIRINQVGMTLWFEGSFFIGFANNLPYLFSLSSFIDVKFGTAVSTHAICITVVVVILPQLTKQHSMPHT